MIRPKQKISTSEKLKDNWISENAYYWDSVCKDAIDELEANILYRAANGELIEESYTHALNPLNSENKNHTRFPAKIKNIDIINAIVMMLMGEKRRRGLNFTAVARNSNIDSVRKEMRDQAYEQMMQAEFINSFVAFAQEQGMEIDMEQIQAMSAEDIEKKVNSMPDKVAIQAQEVINYIIDYNKSFEVFMEGWFHFIVTARAFTYRDVYRDEVIHECVPPLEMKFYGYSGLTALEEAEAHVRRKRMSVNQIIDKFQGLKGFTKDVESELEAKLGYSYDSHTEIKHNSQIDPGRSAFTQMWNKLFGTDGYIYSDEDGIEVKHIVWSSMVKIGLLTTQNIFGEIIQEEVDEDYIPDEDEIIDWVWVEQKWQCYMIDDKHIVGGEPVLNCTGDYYSPKAKKSLYNGRILGMKHTSPTSIVKKGLDYQIKFNLIHYYVENLIAKNLDSISVVPLSLINSEEGLGIEGAMYYARALGFLFVDDTSKQALTALNGIKTLNSNLGQSLQGYFGLINLIKQEWEDSIGVTAPRKGQMNASDGKAVTENAIFRSSIMTEEYFAQYESMQECDLNFLLECSKYAFSEGKKATYISSDNRPAILNVDGEMLNYHDFLVRISSSGKDMDKLAQVQTLAQAFAQNADGRFTPALKAIQGDNISQIVQVMEELEVEIQASIEASKQADRDSQERVAENNRMAVEAQIEFNKYKVDQDNATKLEIARINAEQKAMSEFLNPENAEADAQAVIQNSMNREVQMQQIRTDEIKNIRDNETKKYVADKSLQVAKENKGM